MVMEDVEKFEFVRGEISTYHSVSCTTLAGVTNGSHEKVNHPITDLRPGLRLELKKRVQAKYRYQYYPVVRRCRVARLIVTVT